MFHLIISNYLLISNKLLDNWGTAYSPLVLNCLDILPRYVDYIIVISHLHCICMHHIEHGALLCSTVCTRKVHHSVKYS